MQSQSMTGYGKGESASENFTLKVEIKSVNHRFKDLRFKMGSAFNSIEVELRKKIDLHFFRGSFDVFISYKKANNEQMKQEVDYKKVDAFIDSFKRNISQQNFSISLNPVDFLRTDFYKEDETKEDELLITLPKAFDEALTQLKKSRVEEGAKLIQKLIEHKKVYETFFSEIRALKNSYQETLREKLLKRFDEELSETKIDETRFSQELIYYLEKLDIDEELNRIEIHLKKLDALLSENKPELGRQLDFLVQELNRETNTIGSKSGASEISENVIQMKVQLEKIREQALNMQ